MDILVLGGTGAIGARLVKMLYENGHNVFVTTRKKRESTYSDNGSISYIVGNAHDLSFVTGICDQRRFNAIVDFMIYDSKAFQSRVDYFLAKTEQYVFFSSARVYADSKLPIREDSPRLYDVINDLQYLSTDEYAIKKAKEEDMLINSPNKNWTIIRPYITYGSTRLQLGSLEKEYWLWRALHGKTIVLTRNTYDSLTSLTHGVDVAKVISQLIGNKRCLGEVFHIVNDNERLFWKDILEIYLDVLEKKLGFRPKVLQSDKWQELAYILGNEYQMKYDRFYNRVFDSSKVRQVCGNDIAFVDAKSGLQSCLEDFLSDDYHLEPNWLFEGYADRITREKTSLKNINGTRNVIKYLIAKHFPQLYILRSKLRN